MGPYEPLSPSESALELTRLLLSMPGHRENAHDRAVRLGHAVDPDVLLTELARQRVVVLGLERLADLLADQLDTRLDRARAQAQVANGVRCTLLEAALEEAVTALETARIPVLPLKGPVLARALYDDPALRTSVDLDVLVRRGDLHRAARTLAATAPWEAPPGLGSEPRLHHELPPERAWWPPLEIHWRVHWYEQRFSEELLASGLDGGGGPRRADRARELIALLLFYERDGFLGLRLAGDLAQWWVRYGHEVDGAELARLLRRHPNIAQAAVTAARVAAKVVGLPAETVLCAAGAPAAPRRARAAARLENWRGTGAPEQQRADVDLVDVLLAPPGQVTMAVRRVALPGRRHLVGPRRTSAFEAWWLAVTHPFKLAGRMCVALLRARYRAALGDPPRRITWLATSSRSPRR